MVHLTSLLFFFIPSHGSETHQCPLLVRQLDKILWLLEKNGSSRRSLARAKNMRTVKNRKNQTRPAKRLRFANLKMGHRNSGLPYSLMVMFHSSMYTFTRG